MTKLEMTEAATFGIGTAARLTGLTVHTIRVWERRYGAVVPVRNEGGRRRYTPGQVERLGLLKQLTDLGEAIGSIASLDDPGLRERLQTCREQSDSLKSSALPPLRIAVLSAAPDRLVERVSGLAADVTCVTAMTSVAEFMADLKQCRPNFLLLEYPAIDSSVGDEILAVQAAGHGARCIVLYRFAPSQRLAQLEEADIVTIRGPADDTDLLRAMTSAPMPVSHARPAVPEKPGPGTADDMVVVERRFSDTQLDRLARVTTSVDCECPWHLVDLIRSLTAFEVYSARCESENPDDARLHAYLHAQTSRARALIEESMHSLIVAEGLDVD
jgi:DNA-binding transcriptional MerR regulator